jgi:VWFA-related protein
MQLSTLRRAAFAVLLLFAVSFVVPAVVSAQSKPQKTEKAGDGKKNVRPTEEELKKQEEEKKQAEEEKNAIVDPGIERVETNAVTVDAVVYNKKTGAIITGLKKENFAIFENGVKQNIASFSLPESPITITMVVEYSKWTEVLGSAAGGVWEPGQYEVVRPVAQFLTKFIKPPNDYASVIAYDLRPTPITDFTNDPRRINDTVNLLLRNYPAFRENAMFDAIKLALVGGKADSVVLENSKQEKMEYGGMQDLKAPRKAIILVASGIDTMSKISYDQCRKIIQEAGVPIYVISTGNLFYKKYEQYLPTLDSLSGAPGRMTFIQAQNTMNTLAKESGGAHFPMTFESEIPGILNNINGMLRSQYALSYDLGDAHEPGKKYKLEVKVDVDGDGVYDDKAYVVQARPYFIMPDKNAPAPTNKKK